MLETHLPENADVNPVYWAEAELIVAQFDSPEKSVKEKNDLFRKLVDGDDDLWVEQSADRSRILWATGRGLIDDFPREQGAEYDGLQQLYAATLKDKKDSKHYRGGDLIALAAMSGKLQTVNEGEAITLGAKLLNKNKAFPDMLDLAKGLGGMLTRPDVRKEYGRTIVKAVADEFNSTPVRKAQKKELHAIPGVTGALTNLLAHEDTDAAESAADLLAANDWEKPERQLEFLDSINGMIGGRRDAVVPEKWQVAFHKNVVTAMGTTNFSPVKMQNLVVEEADVGGKPAITLNFGPLVS